MKFDAALKTKVKGLLLPLSPFGRALEWLIEILPRKLLSVEARPYKDVERLGNSDRTFVSKSKQPLFALPRKSGWAPGFYYLEAALTRHSGSRCAQLVYLRTGEDIDSASVGNIIPVSSNLRGSVREVFFLPLDVIRVYWIPTNSCGPFFQSDLLIHKISNFEAHVRMGYRMLLDIARFRGRPELSRHEITIRNALKDVHKTYVSASKLRSSLNTDFSFSGYQEFESKKIREIVKYYKSTATKCQISIVVEIEEYSMEKIARLAESLLMQSHRLWSLIVVCRSHEDQLRWDVAKNALKNVIPPDRLIEFHAHDATSRVECMNGIIGLAQGNFLMHLRENVKLGEHGLLIMAHEFDRHNDAKLIYGDEFHIEGTKRSPVFKSDWNFELFVSHDFIGSAAIFSTEALRSVANVNVPGSRLDRSDLMLQLCLSLDHAAVRHARLAVCEVEVPSEVSLDFAKRRADDLNIVLAPSGASVAMMSTPGFFRANYSLPIEIPMVSVVIPTRDGLDLLTKCVETLRANTRYPSWQIVIVDNDSVDPLVLEYFERLEKDVRIKVLKHPGVFNYARINNFAVDACDGDVVIFLNNDTEVLNSSTVDWMTELVSHCIRQTTGAVGAKLLYSDGTVQHAGVVMGLGGVAGHVHRFLDDSEPGYCFRAVLTQNVSAVTGACLAVQKKKFLEVLGFDENLAVAYNDIDLCLKLLDAGYLNIFTPWAKLIHHESISRGLDDTAEKRDTFLRESDYMKTKWGAKTKLDCYWPQLH